MGSFLLAASGWALERQPVALALPFGSKHQVISANRVSGSLSVVDLTSMTCVEEWDLGGERLSDLVARPETDHLLVTDEKADCVLLVGGGEILSRLSLPQGPVRIAASGRKDRFLVSCQWDRCLAVVQVSGEGELQLAEKLPLPFAPMELLWVEEEQSVLVTDAFGGSLAVVHFAEAAPTVVSHHELPAHNIRGLARFAGGQKVFLSHQRLHAAAQTTIGDVHWGNLLANHLRVIDLKQVLQANADPLKNSRLMDLGEPGRGAGDPAAVAISESGRVAVCLAGVHEVALFGKEETPAVARIPVGQSPVAVVALRGPRDVLVVANRFSDSLSVIDVVAEKVTNEIALTGASAGEEENAVSRGERLFHDARLAFDGWFSCHSCHTDGHTNGQLADTLGDGGFGAPKRVLSLLGVGETKPWAWRGDVESLERQIRSSQEKTMRGRRVLNDTEVSDLAAYLSSLTLTLTLPPPPSPSPEPLNQAMVARGAEVFESEQCDRCHRPPVYTTPKVVDVGLLDEIGQVEFNPPSLRGLRHRDAFFHDGRSDHVEDVFLVHRHQISVELADEQIFELVAFLRSL